MKIVKLKVFLEWYFSDENEEGCAISDKAISNITNRQYDSIITLFRDCKLIPKRLVEGKSHKAGDYKTKCLILIK